MSYSLDWLKDDEKQGVVTLTIPEKKKLHPPPAPKPPKQEIKPEFFIDFNKIANNSSFQRFIIEAIRMSVPQLKKVNIRTSRDVMSKAFNERITEIDDAVKIYDEINEIGKAKHIFKDVIKELKEKLAKQKEKIENESNDTMVAI